MKNSTKHLITENSEQINPSENNSILNYVREIEPTNGQKTALLKLETFFNQNDTQIFVLKGYAGTGKTTISKAIIDFLTKSNKKIYAMALTGRAAKIFRKKTSFPAATIHQTIYTPEINKNLEVEFNLRPEFKDGSILIVDESSMLLCDAEKLKLEFSLSNDTKVYGKNILNDIFEIANLDKNKNTKIVFVGDNAQLTLGDIPYALESSFYVNLDIKIATETLTEVKRNDNGILRIASMYRDLIISNDYEKRIRFENNEEVKKVSRPHFFLTYFEHHPSINDLKKSIIICPSNEKVRLANKMIRKNYFNSEFIQIGDRIMAYFNNYSSVNPHMNGDLYEVMEILDPSHVKTINISSPSENEMYYIRNCQKNNTIPHYIKVKSNNTIEVQLEFIYLKLKDDEGMVRNSYICKHYLDAEGPEKNPLVLRANIIYATMRHTEMKEKKGIMIKDFITQDEMYNAMYVKYAYAMTGHKAQGGEWNNVYTSSIGYVSDFYNRFLYTAFTRAIKKLYIETF
jgi:hypothetical protein